MKFFDLIAGARPNFIKIAPLIRALEARGAKTRLIHTGQHYDANMSDIFFQQLGLRAPDHFLGIGPGDRITQTKKILNALIPLFSQEPSDMVIVVGDVTSTLAGAMAGAASGIPVAHVEAGLRSFDLAMPEELNRMVADHYSSLLFVTETVAVENLAREVIPSERIHLVGNVMIDSLRHMEQLVDASLIHEQLGLQKGSYGLVTLHRPRNVDDPEMLKHLWSLLTEISHSIPLVFPVHPRTRSRLSEIGLSENALLRLLTPVGYVEMLALEKWAKLALTDSAGVQEETTIFGTPCITLREQTERPITVTQGTSEVVGTNPDKIKNAVQRVLNGQWKTGRIPDLWDGHAAERIADLLLK